MDNHSLFSSFGKWISPICAKTFTERVAQAEQDKYVKKLTTYAYLKLFLHAQIQQQRTRIILHFGFSTKSKAQLGRSGLARTGIYGVSRSS
ncbi:DUF4372 domain-containing protein [Paenibacillus baimaensis]|uniref:DUF4372 domain-containing protein n=1 Tax=Paenibacillus baimaensis TaxID=2982185 RepID=UPI0038CD8FAA